MTDTERKALALLNEVAKEMGLVQLRILDTDLPGERALCRAIEQHEAFRQEVSDAVEAALNCGDVERLRREGILSRFVIAKPDPLVEAVTEADLHQEADEAREEYATYLRAAIEKRGGKIVWGEG